MESQETSTVLDSSSASDSFGEMHRDSSSSREDELRLNPSGEQDKIKEDHEVDHPHVNGKQWEPFVRLKRFVQPHKEEIKVIFELSWPTVLTYILNFVLSFINLVYIGHYNPSNEEHPPELPAAAFAITYTNVTGFSVIIGSLSAMDTLCSQSYGAFNYKRVGHILQRALIISAILCLPISALWSVSSLFFTKVINRTEVAELAISYALYLLPCLWFMMVFETLKRWLQAQALMRPVFYVSAAAVPINIAAQYIFIYPFGLGFIGSPLALSFTYACMTLMIIGWIFWSRVYQKTWTGWSMEAFRGWGEYLKLSIPGAMMICAEWWGFEITVVLVGLMDETEVQLGAHAIGFNTLGWCFMIPLGLAVAATTRVGNLLGANEPELAKRSAYITIAIAFVAQLTTMIIFEAIRIPWSKLYSTDPAVIDWAAKILVFMGFLTLFDGVQGACSGVLRGCAKQKIGAGLNLIAYYVISLPIGIPLAFLTSLQLYGIWIGLLIGLTTISLAMLAYIVYWIDWEDAARVAIETAQKNSAPDAEGTQMDIISSLQIQGEEDLYFDTSDNLQTLEEEESSF